MKVLTVSTFLPWLFRRGMPYFVPVHSRPSSFSTSFGFVFHSCGYCCNCRCFSCRPCAPVVAPCVPPAPVHGRYLVLAVPFFFTCRYYYQQYLEVVYLLPSTNYFYLVSVNRVILFYYWSSSYFILLLSIRVVLFNVLYFCFCLHVQHKLGRRSLADVPRKDNKTKGN